MAKVVTMGEIMLRLSNPLEIKNIFKLHSLT